MKREVLIAKMNYYYELQQLTNRDSINKLYRQARVWTRFSRAFAEILTPEESVEINGEFKRLRNERLEEIER